MLKISNFIIAILFVFIPTKLNEIIKLLYSQPELLNSYTVFNKTSIFINNAGFKEEKVFKEYFSFDNGYYVTYNKMGTVLELYKNNSLINSFKQNSSYPRIAKNFLLVFSSDMTKVKVFTIEPFNEVLNLSTKDIITSYHASDNGKYLIIGDMNGDVYVYNHTDKPFKLLIKGSRINYIRGLYIANDGSFIGIGGIYPDILFIGSVFRKNGVKIVKMPSLPRKNIYLKSISNTYFVEDSLYFYIISDDRRERIQKYGKLFDIIQKDEDNFIVIENLEKKFYLRVISNYKVLYNIEVIADYFPLVIGEDRKKIFFHNIGSLIW